MTSWVPKWGQDAGGGGASQRPQGPSCACEGYSSARGGGRAVAGVCRACLPVPCLHLGQPVSGTRRRCQGKLAAPLPSNKPGPTRREEPPGPACRCPSRAQCQAGRAGPAPGDGESAHWSPLKSSRIWGSPRCWVGVWGSRAPGSSGLFGPVGVSPLLSMLSCTFTEQGCAVKMEWGRQMFKVPPPPPPATRIAGESHGVGLRKTVTKYVPSIKRPFRGDPTEAGSDSTHTRNRIQSPGRGK